MAKFFHHFLLSDFDYEEVKSLNNFHSLYFHSHFSKSFRKLFFCLTLFCKVVISFRFVEKLIKKLSRGLSLFLSSSLSFFLFDSKRSEQQFWTDRKLKSGLDIFRSQLRSYASHMHSSRKCTLSAKHCMPSCTIKSFIESA